MSSTETGKIGWIDLTVDDAEENRKFYEAVVGWKSEATKMDGYDDYTMTPSGDTNPVAGICHKKGPNAALPSQWLIYVNVADLDHSLAQTIELGGKIVVESKAMGSYGRYAVIADPAGAVCALFEPQRQKT